jgi:hypothetical protein
MMVFIKWYINTVEVPYKLKKKNTNQESWSALETNENYKFVVFIRKEINGQEILSDSDLILDVLSMYGRVIW